MNKSENKKCPKCGGEMVKSSEQTLGDVFGCTRREPEKPENQRVALVQPYYCKSCGYIELYKERAVHTRETILKMSQ